MPDIIKTNAVVFDGTVVCQYSNNCITLKNNDNDSINIITTKVLNRINTMINDDWGYGTSCYGIYFGVDGNFVFFHDDFNNVVISKDDFISIMNDVKKYNIFK